jgi:hypothetical protein
MEKLKELFWMVFVTVALGTVLGIFLYSVPVAIYTEVYSINAKLGFTGACFGIALYSIYGIIKTLRRK